MLAPAMVINTNDDMQDKREAEKPQKKESQSVHGGLR